MKSVLQVSFDLFAILVSLLLTLIEWCLENSTLVVWAITCTTGAYLVFKYVLSFRVTLHPATSKVFADMVLAFQRESMFCEGVVPNVAIGDDLDADLTHEPVRQDIKLVRSNRRVPYAVRVAHLAKAQVGLLSNVKACELVYARVCRDEMVKHGLRPSHIAHMVPLAVAACFIPLDADFLAASLRQCAQMKDRRALLGPCDSK